MKASTLLRWPRTGAATFALAVTAMAHPAAHASSTYTLDGQFTSFRTWVTADYASPASVGGIDLLDSGVFAGTYLGQNFNWSQTVQLPALTRSVDFTYVAVPPDTSVYEANHFGFTPGADVSVDVGVPFTLGSISFTNGQWFYRTELGVHFTATPDDGGSVSSFDDTLVLLSNSPRPPATPRQQADYFYLAGHPELGSVRVYDSFSQPADNPGSTGMVDFIAQIGSLDPVRFVATGNAAFVEPFITPSVPEPSTWALSALGLLAIGLFRRRGSGGEGARAHDECPSHAAR